MVSKDKTIWLLKTCTLELAGLCIPDLIDKVNDRMRCDVMVLFIRWCINYL